MKEPALISADELAEILARRLNAALGTPVASHDEAGPVFTFATPGTGQLFTVSVTEKIPSAALAASGQDAPAGSRTHRQTGPDSEPRECTICHDYE